MYIFEWAGAVQRWLILFFQSFVGNIGVLSHIGHLPRFVSHLKEVINTLENVLLMSEAITPCLVFFGNKECFMVSPAITLTSCASCIDSASLLPSATNSK